MAISNKMSILGTKKAVMAYNGGYYLPSVSDEGILSWTPTVEGMAPIPEVNIRGPQGSDASVTAEAVQAVVPIAWDGRLVLGQGSGVINEGVAVGLNNAGSFGNAVFGSGNKANSWFSVILGLSSQTKGGGDYQIVIGKGVNSQQQGASALTIAIGSAFSDTSGSYTCTTEGTGSITIGAGANTLNNGDTESSNSVTIGCKALNQGADSVVIGASAQSQKSSPGNGSSAIGATSIGAASVCAPNSVAIGRFSSTNEGGGVSIGVYSNSKFHATSVGYLARTNERSVALGTTCYVDSVDSIGLGSYSNVTAQYAAAIGTSAKAADLGAVVFRSTAEDGTYTQLYFSGANTPLANKYFPTAWEQKQDVDDQGNPKVDENGDPVMVDDKDKPIAGEAMMGFVARDKDGNIIARGANMLSALFPHYTGADENPFAPTTMSLSPGDEPQEVMAFHPSDLDLPVEEPEPAKYAPLPVYPIVEPEIPEIEEV